MVAVPNLLVIEKAQEIIDYFQNELLLGKGRLPKFTNAEKNYCMSHINGKLLPLIGLNRHLTYASSKEAIGYIQSYSSELGYWNTFYLRYVASFFWWRQYRRMGYTILAETGYEKIHPIVALCDCLESMQDQRSEKGRFFGGNRVNVVDIWLFGELLSFKDESLFVRVKERCPKTMEWYAMVENSLET